MTAPVTVSITRHVDPALADEMITWIRAGASLAGRVPGFLGAGWVRPAADSETWHVLYRFADSDSLGAWETSNQRSRWLGAAQGLGVVESRVERRTGIEGWFDEPASSDVRDLRVAPPVPPRWKQACMIWLAFFPLSLTAAWVFGRLAPELALVPRVLLTTLVMTPLMTYVVLPRLTAALAWWLHGQPAPWRRR